MTDYKPVIGLEIHVELKTLSKMFCGCKNDPFHAGEPNIYTCPVCLGMPGALPVPNKKAINWTVLIGKALNCTISGVSKFDRKHYFYPDLPKGYQISQYDEPIASNGLLNVTQIGAGHPTGVLARKFRIRRVHLEEDTAKLVHEGGDTLVDFNRSGVPLVEIVTEPDFDNADDVKSFLEELHVVIRYLEVSDANMEQGSMRLEPNISVRAKGEGLPKYKVEVKNINSFRFVKQAIEYEVERQTEILAGGKIPRQETRGFDSGKGETYSQRSKEEAHDYRYFPEPDIPPLQFGSSYITQIKIPELPQNKVDRYVKDFKMRHQDAFRLTRDKKTVEYFETVCARLKSTIQAPEQSIANFIINKKISSTLPIEDFIAQALELLAPKKTDFTLLDTTLVRIIGANKKAVQDYKEGKENAIMFLVGRVMREMKGKADAKVVKEKLIKKLT